MTFTGCCELEHMEGHCSWQSPPFTAVSSKSQQILHRTTSPLPHVWKPLLLSLSRHRPLRHLEGQSWLHGLARLALCCLTIVGRASWYPTTMFCTKSLVLHSTSRATPWALYLKDLDSPFCIDKQSPSFTSVEQCGIQIVLCRKTDVTTALDFVQSSHCHCCWRAWNIASHAMTC